MLPGVVKKGPCDTSMYIRCDASNEIGETLDDGNNNFKKNQSHFLNQ